MFLKCSGKKLAARRDCRCYRAHTLRARLTACVSINHVRYPRVPAVVHVVRLLQCRRESNDGSSGEAGGPGGRGHPLPYAQEEAALRSHKE